MATVRHMVDYEAAVGLLDASLPRLEAVYLFGSAASGALSPESDIDFAILAERAIDPMARWDLQERLASLLHRDVDLVDLRAASAVMRVQILAGGRLLLDRAPSARALFEAVALADYARLNEERRGILDDVRRRGSVHG